MKNIKNVALIAGVIASLGISTAFAATEDAANTHKMRDKVAAAEQALNAEERPMGYRNINRNRGPRVPNGFKTLADITGKDQNKIAEECKSQKINPAQYADKNGVYAEYKAKRLELAQERLANAVKEGRLTQEKADAALKKLDTHLEDAKAGKMPPRQAKKGNRKGAKMMANGPQGDCLMRRNPDGSVAQGAEGMAYREHPMYGKMPLDTLASITGKSVETLYADAYKSKVTCAGLAKNLGVLDEYKAQRLATQKSLMEKAITDGKITQDQADKMLETLGKRIDDGQHERMGMGRHLNPKFSPMHPGPAMMPNK